MHPVDIHLDSAAATLTIRWSDERTSLFSLKFLRGWCPCALCQGHFAREMTWQGGANATLDTIEPVGSYAIRPVWADGHRSGMFAYDYLRRIEFEPPGDGPSNALLLGGAMQ